MNTLNYKEITPKNINEAISILKDEINIYKNKKQLDYNDASHLKIREKELKDLEAFYLWNKVSLIWQNFLILHNKKQLLFLDEWRLFIEKSIDKSKEIKWTPLIKTSKWRPVKWAKY